ncbi:GAF domain-containing protein [Aeoliella mucimassa]|uniref:GAF domain-containing protein n=1 Tax=Aeoliella mucimassa TaxID=2527972 RepID=UPI0018D342B5|nr:GAF domain-containing protein [Aeoliella mucimassa]
MPPTTVFAGVVPRVRPPQVATSPTAASQQATADARRQALNQRLTAVLQGLVQGFACDAATFYELNSSTTELLLRTEYHAAETESAPARRPLATARADVAALAGSAIVLEDDLDVAGWPVPIWCGAAVCLPVSSDETIHGTLWLYSNEPRAFADAELQLAEVVAGRLAVELELHRWRTAGSAAIDPVAPSETLASEKPTPKPPAEPPAEPAKAPQAPKAAEQKPTSNIVMPRLVRPNLVTQSQDWELAGINCNTDLGSFYDWQTLADGRTLVTSGAIGQCDHESWLEAARIALRAHAMQSLDAGELLTNANQTLWLASPGGEGLAVAVALLDGDGAHVSVAAAGEAGIARWRAATCDWTPANCPPLGWSERTIYTPKSAELVVRERLILATASDKFPAPNALMRLADKLRHNSPADLRTLPGKRALRLFSEAAGTIGLQTASLALVRRR